MRSAEGFSKAPTGNLFREPPRFLRMKTKFVSTSGHEHAARRPFEVYSGEQIGARKRKPLHNRCTRMSLSSISQAVGHCETRHWRVVPTDRASGETSGIWL